ncbi:MAG: ATP-dependent Clp protease ATP-binding subunit [Oscillospiraceae bacterium]|nr:ATP-dependent Clp protease ATP-binding subunit [Oscillospiraceae bacterium]
MICSRCKKRQAAVFITTMNGNERKNEGICLVCAKEMGLTQIDDYMKQMGISDEDLEAMSEIVDEDSAEGDSFEMGGISNAMPNFIANLMGRINPNAIQAQNNAQNPQQENTSETSGQTKKSKKQEKAEKKKELKYLGTYCTNLNERAAAGQLDRIIGREREIDRVMQILSRRQKNNPCLIGEPGVGKTAIAEGIAQKIVSGDVPYNIKNKQVYLLDLTALVAGTQFRGQFESRMKGLIEEVKREGNVILFIDEVHRLVGTGDNDGTMNAANILKPALSRGEVQVIGATTFKEYRKYIEKDSALERRFQPVTVAEPTVDDTVQVLFGIRKYYEDFHHVKITDSALRICAVLSERYINDRFLPDKAIDLLDEACAGASIRSPEISRAAELNEQLAAKKDEVAKLEEDQNPDYEKIAEAKASLSQLENECQEAQAAAEQVYVNEDDLSRVIELWTGIPANKIVETEYDKIRGLHDALSAKIVGQPEAIDLVCNAIKRTRVQLTSRQRPASFIFVGPTGVGKTELAKVLAAELFDATEPLIRIDMSEYMEKHTVSRLIGSPPGYVGYDEAGQLTEKVRRKPYSVVLFDEIEKAHPDVMNILLQILDEGKVNDAQGRSVSFEHTVIIMTSNAGSTDKSFGIGFDRTEAQASKERAIKGLREFLRPEFISRVDEIVVFNPLTEKDYADIAHLMLGEMVAPLSEKLIMFNYDRAAEEAIAHIAISEQYGARDIRRIIRREVEDKIANLIVDSGEIKIRTINLTAQDGKLIVMGV